MCIHATQLQPGLQPWAALQLRLKLVVSQAQADRLLAALVWNKNNLRVLFGLGSDHKMRANTETAQLRSPLVFEAALAHQMS